MSNQNITQIISETSLEDFFNFVWKWFEKEDFSSVISKWFFSVNFYVSRLTFVDEISF